MGSIIEHDGPPAAERFVMEFQCKVNIKTLAENPKFQKWNGK